MNARERRALILKNRPKIRRIDVSDDRDIGIVWADYQRNPEFPGPKGLAQEDFADQFKTACAFWDSVYFVEDDSKVFRSGRGPVGVIKIKTNGWRIEPEATVFSWATKRNILRCCVAFFQMIRHDRSVGACVVFAPESAKKLLDRMFHYDVLFRAGRIRDAIPGALAHVYVIRGKRDPVRTEQTKPEIKAEPEVTTEPATDERRRLDPWSS